MAGQYDLGSAYGKVVVEADTTDVDKAGKSVDDLGKKGESAGKGLDKLANASLLVGTAIVGAFALAIKTTADFEQRLSAIAAVGGQDALDNFDKIREKALQIGKDTAFGATDAASAMEELVKAGVSVADVLGGAADATVALAAAGEVDLPAAAAIAASAMNQFQLTAQELPHVVNLLAGAANASATGVLELGESLKYVGPVAHAMGMSIDDASTAIALLGNNGIIGSQAGTVLRGILTRLEPTGRRAAAAMKELGLITADGSNQFYDAAGNVKPFNEIVNILQGTFGKLNGQQTATYAKLIFGQEAMAGVAAIAGTTDEKLKTLNDTMMNTDAAEIAKTRQDNFKGSLEQLGGSLETLQIQVGSILIPILRNLADMLSTVVDNMMGFVDATPQGVIVATAFAGALLLLLGGGIKVVKWAKELYGAMILAKTGMLDGAGALKGYIVRAISAAQATLALSRAQIAQGREMMTWGNRAAGAQQMAKGFGTAASGLLSAFNPVTLAIAVATAGLLLWMQHTQDAKARIDELSGSIDVMTGKLTEQGDKTITEKLVGEIDPKDWEFLDTLGLGLDDARKAISGTKEEMTAFIDKANESSRVLAKNGINTRAVTNNVWDWHNAMQGAREEQNLLATQTNSAGDSMADASPKAAKMAEELQKVEQEASDATKALDTFEQALDQSAAMDKFRSDLNDITKVVKDNGTALEGNKPKAIANRDALRGMFGDVAKAAEAWGERYGKSQDEVQNKAATLMRQLRKHLLDNGFDKGDLDKFMAGLDGLPSDFRDLARQTAKDFAAGMAAAGKEGAAGLAIGLELGKPQVMAKVNQMTRELIAEAHTGLEVNSPSKVFIRLGGSVVEGLTLGLANTKGLSEKARSMIEAAIDASEKRIDKFVDKQKDRLDEAISKWQDYRDAVFEALTGNVSASDAFAKADEQAKAVKEAQDALAKAQQSAADSPDSASAATAVAEAQAQLDAATSQAKDWQQNLIDTIDSTEIFSKIFDKASDALAQTFGKGSQVWQMMTQSMLEMSPEQGALMAQQIVDNGLDPVLQQKLIAWSAWSKSVANAQAAKNYGQGISTAAKLLAGVEDKVAKEEARIQKIGENIGNGMIIGFQSKQSAFKAAVDAYIQTAMDSMKIKSPSRVFMEIGQYMGEGMNIGLANRLGDTRALFDDMKGYLSDPQALGFSMAGAAAPPVPAPQVNVNPSLGVRVMIGDRDITDIVRTEIVAIDEDSLANILGGV